MVQHISAAEKLLQGWVETETPDKQTAVTSVMHRLQRSESMDMQMTPSSDADLSAKARKLFEDSREKHVALGELKNLLDALFAED